MQYRQGDVLLVKVKGLPKVKKNWKQVATKVVAYGEVTGHAHKLDGGNVALLEDPETSQMFVSAEEPFALKHEEHGQLDLEPGVYKVVHQMEYTPEKPRRVID